MKKLYEDLSNCGIDIEASLARFLGNEQIYERFLQKFLDDKNFFLLEEAIKNNNYEDALTYSHTLKGVTGNLGMDSLFKLLEKQVNDIRNEDYQTLSIQQENIAKLYFSICDAIKNNLQA